VFFLGTDCILLQDVHEMNVYRADRACLSVHPCVRMIKLENRWTDLDEIWYRCAYLKILPFNILQPVIPTWRTNEPVRWDRH
jgi:hypothetical protein